MKVEARCYTCDGIFSRLVTASRDSASVRLSGAGSLRNRPGAALRAAELGGGVPGSRRVEERGRPAALSARRRRTGAAAEASAVRRRPDAGRRAAAADRRGRASPAPAPTTETITDADVAGAGRQADAQGPARRAAGLGWILEVLNGGKARTRLEPRRPRGQALASAGQRKSAPRRTAKPVRSKGKPHAARRADAKRTRWPQEALIDRFRSGCSAVW